MSEQSGPEPLEARLGRMVPENVYGSQKRLRWIASHLGPNDLIVDFGCGTGAMVTLPLARLGCRVIGLDSDERSVEFGRRLLAAEGLDPELIRCSRLADLEVAPDVIIASEVLEHLPEPALGDSLDAMRRKLKPDGSLLVTVPNGYGWFEIESFLWHRTGVGALLEWTRGSGAIVRLKRRLLGADPDPHPSTLSPSPHVQRFTFRAICSRLEAHGFAVREAGGSVFACGPFSNLLVTGPGRLMRLNAALGTRFPRAAAAFFVRATPRRANGT